MDERRRDIADLRKRIEEYGASLDLVREELAAIALSDPRAETVFAEAVAEGKRLERDLAEARRRVREIEDDSARIRELRTAEREKKNELERMRKDTAELRIRLGEALLESDAQVEGFAPFRQRIDALAARIEEQEGRIGELDAMEEGEGLIARLGRSARAALLRSSQSARRAEGRRVLAEAGAALAARDSVLSSDDEAVREAAEALSAHLEAIDRDEADIVGFRASLKELRERLDAASGKVSSGRGVAHLEKTASELEGDLAVLRRGIGARLLAPALGEKGSRKAVSDLVSDFMADGRASEIVAKARENVESIAAAKRQIEKIEASIRMDALSSELRRLRSDAAEHERRIASSSRALEELGSRISKAEREIASLSSLVEGR